MTQKYNMSARRWCYTINNFNEGDCELLKGLPARYHVYGKEVGESGTPHLQGFVIFEKTKRLSALKKIHASAHWEIAKGTSQQASDYCKKDGEFVEIGVLSEQGKRTDLKRAIDDIDEGIDMATVAKRNPEVFVKFARGLRDYALATAEPYEHCRTRGVWIYGPPGSGKSHAARRLCPDAYLKAQNKWWDGYCGQEYVILDDLDTSTLGHYLKIWTDKYACTGETKGGTTQLKHKLFVITSNYAPESLWPEDPVMAEAVTRRCQVIIKNKRDELIDHLVLKDFNDDI